jgi:lysophospholipase L1-like esterase
MTYYHAWSRAVLFAVALVSGSGMLHAQEPPIRIMPLGDSITYGEALTSIEGGYRNRLYTLLTPPNRQFNPDYLGTFQDANNPTLPDVDHQGWPGARTDMLRSRIDDWLRQIEDPDVVLLMIGTNDLWQNRTVSATLANLNNLISDIAIRRPFAKIIVSNLPPRTDSQTYENLQLQYNAGIPGLVSQHVALGRQVTMVDIHSALGPFDLSSDGVHPSSSGYNKMAGVWAPAISAVTSPQGGSNPPVIARTAFPENPTSVSVVFSKPVADDAANPANFSISGGLSISNAVLDAATKRIITLTTGPQAPGVVQTLSVSGVRDRTPAQNMIAPQSMVAFSASAITNGSFENDYNGWTATGNQSIALELPYEATDGMNMVAFNDGNRTANGTLSRSFPTVIGRTYALTFDMGVLAYGNANAQRLQVSVQGATSLINDTPTLNGLGGTGYSVRWSPLSYAFTANSTTTTLAFSDVSSITNSIDLLLDNVRICAPQQRTLSLTSWPASGAGMAVSPNDLAGLGGGTTGLIRSYNDGSTVTVTAPASLSGGAFLKWRKNGVDMPGSSPVINITMDGNHALTAVYQPVTGPNNPPSAVADAYVTTAGGTMVVSAPGVLANDSDPDGNGLTAVSVTPPAHGVLSLEANGAFSYTPTAGYTGGDSFVYRASDGSLFSNNVTVSLTVNPAPSQYIVNGSFESSFSSWTSSGNVAVQSGSPYVATNGTRCVSFNTGNQQVNGLLSQGFATVSGQTYALEFDAGTYSTKSGNQRLRTTLAGASSLFDQTTTLGGSGKGMTWQSFSHVFTADSATTLLTFRDVSTTTKSIDLVLDNVRVYPVAANHPPVANPASLETGEDSPLAIALGGSDPDGDDLTFVVTVFPTHGALGGTAPNVTYTPAANFNGADSFTFTVSDGIAAPVAGTVSITVQPFNDAPVANNQSLQTNEDTALPVTLTGNDVDGNTLAYQVTGGPAHGMLSGNAPNLTYTPTANFHGADSFTYTVSDGIAAPVAGTVSISVIEVGGTPFEEWAAIYGIDPDPTKDPDGDSLNNAVEYVVGGDPGDGKDGGLQPQGILLTNQPFGEEPQEAAIEHFYFTYRMARRVRNDVLTQVAVEWATDPAGPWTAADGSHGETTAVEEGAEVDLVHVFIPLIPEEGRLFARLRVTISPEP